LELGSADFLVMDPVSTLRQTASQYGLDTSGSKTALMDRIQRHMKLNGLAAPKPTKKRHRKKRTPAPQPEDPTDIEPMSAIDTELHLIPETINLPSELSEFNHVFKAFEYQTTRKIAAEEELVEPEQEQVQESSSDEDYEAKVLSKKKQAKLNRMSIATLKAMVRKPEIVDVFCANIVG
jgi:hypothetical protein